MGGDLPFPITFELPVGWRLVSPESSDQKDAAYVVVRDHNAVDPITTNVVISGFGVHGVPVDVATLAGRHMAYLQSRYKVDVLKQEIVSEAPTQEFAQFLHIEYPAEQEIAHLSQIQIISAFHGVDTLDATAVLELVMTCPVDIFKDVGPEFSGLVSSIAPTISTTSE